MRRAVALVTILIGVTLHAPLHGADLGRGKLLYETRCLGCHDKSVHNRAARKALSVADIKAQVRRWDDALGKAWRDDEVDDVAAYLNELYYKYPCEPDACPDKTAHVELERAHECRMGATR
jgi:hypothetical protein